MEKRKDTEITVDVSGLDWELLREQKEFLLSLKNDYAAGLVSLLDTIQDQAAEVLGEWAVFGKL
jgi:hypothetical protein